MSSEDIQKIRDHAALQSQLSEARARIAALESEEARLASETVHLRAELANAIEHSGQTGAEAARQADKIARMQASGSWRLTSPIRAIRRFLFDRSSAPETIAAAKPTRSEPRHEPAPPIASTSEPTIGSRSDYKAVWDRQAGDSNAAKVAVAGYTDEAELRRTAARTEQILESTTGLRPDDVILEIGCGVGRVGTVLAPRCKHWIGTDISGKMVRHAQERLAAFDNITVVELSTVGLAEIPDASVDLVYCTVVFMHLYEWDRWQYVKEAFRVLKPGGRCHFDNMAIGSEHGWQMLLAGAAFPLDRRPAHLSMVSSGEELESYATRAGFDDVKVHRFDEGWVAVAGRKP